MPNMQPISASEMQARGWQQADFVYISGDAYVDHPSFGTAIIARVLESRGYKVAILPQPNPDKPADFTQFGRPRLGFLVSSGNVDSMVNHYTVAKKRRAEDDYSPGGMAGKRPDRAVTVYTQTIRKLYPDAPIVIGGVEASLRRFAHYDYWDDAVRPSVLMKSGADLLSYGMGERSIAEIADRLNAGEAVQDIRDVRGTCYLTGQSELPGGYAECASFAKVRENTKSYARAFAIQYNEHDCATGKTVVQKHGDNCYLVQNPPAMPLEGADLDAVYALPFTRRCHPSYEKLGGVPAIREVEFSLAHNRGCFGGCNFCAIAVHQGRHVTVRSVDSVVKEAKEMTGLPGFKGYIHDVGGPTANFRAPSCKNQLKKGMCSDGKKCLAPQPCAALQVDHSEYREILTRLRELPKVKRVFVRSGIRFDYLNLDRDEGFFDDLVQYHVSGQLKVAPEHCAANVLAAMGKPGIAAYKKFQRNFYKKTEKIGKKQYLVPYLMSSHPGSNLREAVELAVFLKQENLRPQQVQDFYPTPFTVSTTMYHTGLDPFTMKDIYVAKSPHEKAMQRALMQYFLPQNRELVREALIKAGRRNLIGLGPDCLIKPDTRRAGQRAQNGQGGADSNRRNAVPGGRSKAKARGRSGATGRQNRKPRTKTDGHPNGRQRGKNRPK